MTARNKSTNGASTVSASDAPSLKEQMYKEFMKLENLDKFFKYRNSTRLGSKISAKFIEGGKIPGYEDDGESTHTVYEFVLDSTKEKVYARFNGVYSSLNGLEISSWEFVVPKEVTEIKFEKE